MPANLAVAFYATPEARRVADNIVSFQTPAGGWGKNVDRDGPVRVKGQHSHVPVEHLPANARTGDDEAWSYVGTIDNNATTSELRFFARVQAMAPGAEGSGIARPSSRACAIFWRRSFPMAAGRKPIRSRAAITTRAYL